MSYGQFGYPAYSTPSQISPGNSSPSTSTTISCCDSRRGMTPDPHTDPQTTPPAPTAASNATVCPLPAAAAAAAAYESRLLSSYPRLATGLPATTGFFNGTPYGADQGSYSGPLTTGVEPPAFYTNLNSAYGIKEAADPWRGLAQPASYYYDPTFAAYGYGSLDFNGARRKNVTRDSTTTLKAWLHEHRKNPYPTKGEKIMLAIITKMTLTQVSTWFANARRRLKKENKMTWEPRNKSEVEDHDMEGSNSNSKTPHNSAAKDSECAEWSDKQCGLGASSQRARDTSAVSADSCGEDSTDDGTAMVARGTRNATDMTSASIRTTADVCRDGFATEMNTGHSLRHGGPGYSETVSSSRDTIRHQSVTSSTSESVVVVAGVRGDMRENAPSTYTPSGGESASSSPDLQNIDSLLHSPQTVHGDHHGSNMDSPVGCDPLHSGSASTKPKIWSLADTATSKSPSPPSLAPSMPDASHLYSSSSHSTDLVTTCGAHRSWFSTPGYAVSSARPSATTLLSAGGNAQFAPYHQHGTASGTVSIPYGATGSHGFSPVSPQTDTPPQTPPNMKVATSLPFHLGSSGSYLSNTQSHLYIGQGTAVCNSGAQLPHIPADKSLCMYPLNHVNGLTSAISGNRDEYLSGSGSESCSSAQYRAPPVQ